MKRLLKLSLQKPELAALLLLVILIGVFQFTSNGFFLSYANMRGLLGFLPEMALVAVGVTLLMICGEFDLSVGSVFALMPMTMAVLMVAGWGFVPAAAFGLLVCAAIGFINGFLTIKFGIPSFITTLGMLFMARSMTVVISGGFPPRLQMDRIPEQLFIAFVGPGDLLRALFFGLSVSRFHGVSAGQNQLRQLGARHRWVSSRRTSHGHTHCASEDRVLHDLLDAGGLCRHDPGAASGLAAAINR